MVLGVAALVGGAVALAMCVFVVVTAGDGGGVDFALIYYLVAGAVLIAVGAAALTSRQPRQR
ncbi:hypothetical protein [Curtobacterium sp. VKM Ac-2922]|uniref:hypothetical protein n=1 Tax=Curtobacterium sp. VKM Ac-2922 TaxID=2929475 RepID=UPI001FB403BC|nr:hypothetical protein [Curtobacterium sp. VKM Ac-2922]MCJ1715217.1 hypothetical protein [Curtobacterium sp. VKM Ac-2922]